VSSSESRRDKKYRESHREKHFEEKVDKKLNRAENKLENKVEKKLNRAEDALEHKMKKKIDNIEDKIEDDLFDELYEKIDDALRTDGCLFVNGSDAYGSYWSKEAQLVTAAQPFVLTNSDTILNVDQKPASGELYICRDGVYKIEFTLQVDQSGVVAMAVNNNTIQSTITPLYPKTANVLQKIMPLKRGSVIKFWNYDLSGMGVLTTPVLPYMANNLTLTLFKIGPWNKKFGGCCAVPPVPQYKKCKKDSRSSKSSSSSSESECKKKKCEVPPKRKHKKARSYYSSSSSSSSDSSSSSSSDSSRSRRKSVCSRSSSDYTEDYKKWNNRR
jgi:hypothetical protein